MANEIEITQRLHLEVMKKELQDVSNLPLLQKRLDDAEKRDEVKFQDFTDTEILKWYLNERKHLFENDEKADRTIREYERELIMFVHQLLTYSIEIDLDIEKVIDGSLFKSLQPRHLRRYQDWLREESPYVRKNGPYAKATLNRKTTIVKSFFIYLHKKKYINESLVSDMLIIKMKSDDRPNRDLGPSDVVSLLNAFRDIEHTIMFTFVHVFVTTGLRNEELCRLKVEDVKRDSILGGYYLDVMGKGNKERQIPLKEKVVQSINNFRNARGQLPIEQAESSEPLFTTNRGNAYSPSYLSQYISKEIVKLSGTNTTEYKLSAKSLRITPHVFRHAFAIISQRNGVTPFDISKALGHDDIGTTMIYLDKVLEKERHAIHSWNPDDFGDYI